MRFRGLVLSTERLARLVGRNIRREGMVAMINSIQIDHCPARDGNCETCENKEDRWAGKQEVFVLLTKINPNGSKATRLCRLCLKVLAQQALDQL
jgi:hypothetical protein